MSRLLQLLRSSGGQAVLASGAVIVLTVITGVLTARLLSVEERGASSAILALCGVLAQAGAAGPAEAYLLARRRGIPAGVVTRVTWLTGLAITGACAAPALLYAQGLITLTPVLALVVAVAPASAAVGMLSNYVLLSQLRFGASAALRVSPVIVQIIFLVVIWQTNTANVASIIAANWAGTVVAGGIALVLARPWRERGGRSRVDGRPLFPMMVHLGGSQAVRILGVRIDLILLGIIAGTYDAGLYSVAVSLTAAGSSLIANLTPLIVTRSEGTHSARFTQVSSLFALMVAAGIAVLGPLVVPLVYGADYAPGWPLMVALALSLYAAFCADSLSRILQRAGLERASFLIALSTLVVQVGCVLVGSSLLGSIGAATANVVAYSLGIVALLVVNRRKRRIAGLSSQISPIEGVRVLVDHLRSK